VFCVLCVFTLCLRFYVMFYVCIVSRAGSVSVFGIGILKYSVFSIGIGISEMLVENRKFLVPPPLFGAPVEGDPVGISQSGSLLEN